LKKGGVEVDITALGAWRKKHDAPPSTEASPSKRQRTGMFSFFGSG